MTTPEVVMWLAVAVVGIPAAWRNPTAAALVIAWFAGQGFYLITDNSLPVDYYLFADIFVITVIFAKPEDCNLAPYKNIWRQLRCLALERSRSDRVVMMIYPLAWLLYVADIHPYHKWMLLWALAILQFLAAGWESFILYRRDADAVSRHPEPPGTSLLVAYQGGGKFG